MDDFWSKDGFTADDCQCCTCVSAGGWKGCQEPSECECCGGGRCSSFCSSLFSPSESPTTSLNATPIADAYIAEGAACADGGTHPATYEACLAAGAALAAERLKVQPSDCASDAMVQRDNDGPWWNKAPSCFLRKGDDACEACCGVFIFRDCNDANVKCGTSAGKIAGICTGPSPTPFNHLLWAIPVAVFVVLALSAAFLRKRAARTAADLVASQEATALRESELSESGVTIFVRALDGKPAQVRASERDTVAKLKALIEAELSMPAEKQVLVAGLAQLQDGSVLRELIADGTLDPTTPLRVAVAD